MTPKEHLISDILNGVNWRGPRSTIKAIVDLHWPKDPVVLTDKQMLTIMEGVLSKALPKTPIEDARNWYDAFVAAGFVAAPAVDPEQAAEADTADREPEYGDWQIAAPGVAIPALSESVRLTDCFTAYRVEKPAPVRSVKRWYGYEYADGREFYSLERQPQSIFWEDRPLIDGKPDFSRQPTWGKL